MAEKSTHWDHLRAHPKLLATIPCDYIHDLASRPVQLHLFAYHDSDNTDSSSGNRGSSSFDLHAPHFRTLAADLAYDVVTWQHHFPLSVSGLICLEFFNRIKICNPSTGQRTIVPGTGVEVGQILPRYGQLSLASSVHAREVLVFVWTVNSDYFCLLYNARSKAFTRRAKLQVPLPCSPGYPLYCPMVDQLSITDHKEKNSQALEGFVSS
ncbi:hypothetical protein CRG98_023771 [Punica granatum]|uniref:Uncharacterized protein n=1 Tax=Punica granatum TaxID=22663 RepID=A0A2I0JHT9_PUNGR|nr:hypothetical protein CRG98_023771 [Punica granatum]